MTHPFGTVIWSVISCIVFLVWQHWNNCTKTAYVLSVCVSAGVIIVPWTILQVHKSFFYPLLNYMYMYLSVGIKTVIDFAVLPL